MNTTPNIGVSILRTSTWAFVMGITAWAQAPQAGFAVTKPIHAVSPKLSQLSDSGPDKFVDHPPLALPARAQGQAGQSQARGDAGVQTQVGPLVGASQGPQFDGIGANGSAPPDTNIA